jgi:hypothetical protein
MPKLKKRWIKREEEKTLLIFSGIRSLGKRRWGRRGGER